MFGRDEKVSHARLTAVQYIILGIFFVLAYGLWRLQVAQGDLYSSLAEKNRVRNVPILAPRGKILDREGRTIVDNYPSFTALLLRDSSRDLLADSDIIAHGLHMDPKEMRERIRKFSSMPQYQPIRTGKTGYPRACWNSRGKEVGRLEESPAVPGKQLKLTIDIDLQIAAEQALEGKNGAIIAMDPRNGEILAMVSRPTFDPND